MLYFINIQLANIAHQVLLNTAESKAAFSHLLNCLVLVPALYNNTVDRTQHPSAVDPMPAVHKDRRPVTVRDDLQETIIRWADYVLIIAYQVEFVKHGIRYN
jgi:hypothetical protein